MPLEAGSNLGPYEILSPLGAGGMGEVYRARDSRLDREVAVKILPEGLAEDPERSARFAREARVLGNLNHPHIATLHGYEADGSTRFLVMELVPGQTLADRIARGPIPVDETVALFLQIAEGLEAAHAQGVIHRDLKPANVKITAETPDSPGRVKILDFGLAKALAPEALSSEEPVVQASESPTLSYLATMRGEILGTAAYMSPEQARGRVVDRRTDVWAFGVCLYEALTGVRAFCGETPTDVIAQIVTRDPDWGALPEATPIGLRHLLRRCLERDPRRRLRDIGDGWVELDSVARLAGGAPADGTAYGAHVPDRAELRFRSRLVWLLAGATVSALAVWAMTRQPPPAPAPVTRFAVDLGSTEAFPVQEFSSMVAVSRDGRELAVSINRGDRVPRLYRRSLDRLDLVEIRGPEFVYSPFFSPDGEWLGYQDPIARKLMKIPLAGGAAQALCDSFPPLGATWLNDGSIVFVSRAQGSANPRLFRVLATGGAPEPLFQPPPQAVHMHPSALPEDRGVLFDEYGLGPPSVAVFDLAAGREQTLIESASNAVYTSSGHLVFFREGALWAAAFDLDSLRVIGPEALVQPEVEGHTYAVYALSQDGVLVYSPAREGGAGGVARLAWIDRTGNERPVAAEARSFEDLRISPDGRRLAVVIGQGLPLSRDVWVYDLEGRPPVRLTSGGMNGSPVWTPDGSAVTFADYDRAELVTVQRDGGAREPTAPGVRIVDIDRVVAWSPDGDELLMVKDVGLGTNLVIWSQSDRQDRPLLESEFLEIEAALSPDGRWVAYVSNVTGTLEVYVRPYAGVGPVRRVSAAGGRTPRFSRRGDEIFFASGNRMMAATFAPGSSEPEVGAPVELFAKEELGEFDIGPDGRFLVALPASGEGAESSHLVVVEGFLAEIAHRAPAARPP